MLIAPMDGGMHSYSLDCGHFVMPTRYTFNKVLASGAQGIVCSATDVVERRNVAIKKFWNPFCDAFTARRVYREIKLMQCAKHKNLIALLDAFSPQNDVSNLQDVYLVTEQMDTDLSKVVNMRIDHTFMSYIIYQICCGIDCLHSLGIIHRDLKPSNIGVNARGCVVKILDFGLARSKDGRFMSPYVTTRQYRAPEVVLGMEYGTKVDIWSIGCIFAELILGFPLFYGSDLIDQWCKIVALMGTPDKNFTKDLSSSAKLIIDRMPLQPGLRLEQIFPDGFFANRSSQTVSAEQYCASKIGTSTLCASQARDLISRMLVVDPEGRFSVTDALRHPYISFWYEDEDQSGNNGDVRLDPAVNINANNVQEYRCLIFNELNGVSA
ncbi:Mitogen-activated protein kinase 9 [Toxocara canis]|uniref:Stress-activated protein kinase JNK n=1 Tax=Toxocara canis TaxID=6265 RepID=A0A0B2VXS8_TOXCA|nr:Mitogen-activated protein kinase 9 [Toxocara canis]